jgi:hypothetical protein
VTGVEKTMFVCLLLMLPGLVTYLPSSMPRVVALAGALLGVVLMAALAPF